MNVNNQFRNSLFDAFLNNEVLKRKNLFIKKNMHVTKILFSGDEAIGVEALLHGTPMKFYSTKETILSAGAYNSP